MVELQSGEIPSQECDVENRVIKWKNLEGGRLPYFQGNCMEVIDKTSQLLDKIFIVK